MRVGFTGTRDGMTKAQLAAFRRKFAGVGAEVFRHGYCVGADEEAAVAVVAHHPEVVVLGHPSSVRDMTSGDALDCCDDTLPPRGPLTRNKHIVDGCETLIACPKGPEETRSGTWSTVRYARKKRRRIVIIWPDGSVTEEAGK